MTRICPMCKRKMTDPKRIKYYAKIFGPNYCRFCGYNKGSPPSKFRGDRIANQKSEKRNLENIA